MEKRKSIIIMLVIIAISAVFYVNQYQELCPSQTVEGEYKTVDRGICLGDYTIENGEDESITINRYDVKTSEEKFVDTYILKPGEKITIEKRKGFKYKAILGIDNPAETKLIIAKK